MKPLDKGKLLNAKLSVRLAIIDTVSREKLIEEIAKNLFRAANANKSGAEGTIQDWYRPRKGQ